MVQLIAGSRQPKTALQVSIYTAAGVEVGDIFMRVPFQAGRQWGLKDSFGTVLFDSVSFFLGKKNRALYRKEGLPL